MKIPGGELLNLTPKQQEIFGEMYEEGIPTPEGKRVTGGWVKDNFDGNGNRILKERKKKTKKIKAKRKTKNCGCK